LLSVAEINARLKDRYKALAGGARTLPTRQQTLRALVDWSYELLNDGEKCVLDRLGVFVGGFDLRAAEAVCGAEPVDPPEVMDVLGSLVEKSLVMSEDREDGTRFRMLETIREYAQEKLQQRGEDAAATAARHCEHFFAFAKEARDGILGADQALWVRRVEMDRENLRAATSLALAGRVDPFIAVKIAVALVQFWILRGYFSEGRGVVRAALALPAVQSSDLARAFALEVGAVLAGSQGDHAEARRMLETCLELRRGLGDPLMIAGTLTNLSLYRLDAADPVAATDGEREALQIFRQQGNRIGETVCLVHQGRIALYQGDAATARARLAEALATARETGYEGAHGEVELLFGKVALMGGDRAEAEAHLNCSLGRCRDSGDRLGEANALRWLGKTSIERGDLDAARRRLADALRTFQEFEMRGEMVACIEDHALLMQREGRLREAAQLAGAAAQSRVRLSLVRTPREESLWEAFVGDLRATLGEGEFDSAWQRGQQWEARDAVSAALASVSPLPPARTSS
jgi:tetratricopeptide (TPR) repeat protein